MQHTPYILDNPEIMDKPLNTMSLNTAINVCKHRDGFAAECKRKKLPVVPAFPYIGIEPTAKLQYTGDVEDGFSIDCSDNEHLTDELVFFVLGKKNNLLSLFQACGIITCGMVNDLDLIKELEADQFNILYKFGAAIQQLIDNGQIIVNERKRQKKVKKMPNIISAITVDNVKTAKVKTKPKKLNLNSMTKAQMAEQLRELLAD